MELSQKTKLEWEVYAGALEDHYQALNEDSISHFEDIPNKRLIVLFNNRIEIASFHEANYQLHIESCPLSTVQAIQINHRVQQESQYGKIHGKYSKEATISFSNDIDNAVTLTPSKMYHQESEQELNDFVLKLNTLL